MRVHIQDVGDGLVVEPEGAQVGGDALGLLLTPDSLAFHHAASPPGLLADAVCLAARFREQCGSIICRELLEGKADSGPTPTERTAEFYKKRPCAELVALAAKILGEELENGKC